MNLIKKSLLAITIIITGFSAAMAQSADDIMGKYAAATGYDNWDKVKTMKTVMSFAIQGQELNMTLTSEKDKAQRIDMNVMGMTGWVIIAGKQGWSFMPPMMGGTGKVDTLKPEMMAMFQKQADMKGQFIVDYKKEGTKLEYLGKDTINNSPCYKVKMTTKEGKESTNFIDCSSYYLVRLETTAKVQDMDQEVAIGFSNYQKLDGGITWPMSMNAAGQDITYKSVELNKPVDASIFIPKAPEADAAGGGSGKPASNQK